MTGPDHHVADDPPDREEAMLQAVLRVIERGAAGAPLDIATTKRLAEAILLAVREGQSIEAALGLPPRWRDAVRRRRAAGALGALWLVGEPTRRFAQRVRSKLLALQRRSPRSPPRGELSLLHNILDVCGAVPCISTLRAWAPRLGGQRTPIDLGQGASSSRSKVAPGESR